MTREGSSDGPFLVSRGIIVAAVAAQRREPSESRGCLKYRCERTRSEEGCACVGTGAIIIRPLSDRWTDPEHELQLGKVVLSVVYAPSAKRAQDCPKTHSAVL